MGFKVTTYDEFTTNNQVNKAVLGLSVIRLFLFFCIFILNLNQTYHEFNYARKKRKYFNARLFTFGSITIYPFTRLFMIGVFFYDKSIYNGSYTACLSIWGTLFQYLEWVYICLYWCSILYVFFIRGDVRFRNTQRVWIGSIIISIILVLWTILQTVFNFYYLDLMNSTYGIGQIIVVVGIGGFFLANGIVLVNQMKKSGSKNPKFEHAFKRVQRMSLALFILIVGVFLVTIIRQFILKLKEYETANYAFYVVLCLLEFTQLGLVMYSLGGESFKNYLGFNRIVINSNSSKAPSIQSASNYEANQNKSFGEINLNDYSNSNSNNNINTISTNSLTLNTSLTNLINNDENNNHISKSNSNFDISVSVDINDNN